MGYASATQTLLVIECGRFCCRPQEMIYERCPQKRPGQASQLLKFQSTLTKDVVLVIGSSLVKDDP